VEFSRFETPHGRLSVLLTTRLRKKCKKGRIWKSSAMLTSLKNAAYGYDPKTGLSRGGSDGIFRIDREFKPVNSMMKKLFTQFIDKPDPLVAELESYFSSHSSEWVPVRLVSHHLRLLGLFYSQQLVLVDYDSEKG